MIAAEQWNDAFGAPDGSLDHQVDVIPSALLPKIQADARRQGLRDAIEILEYKLMVAVVWKNPKACAKAALESIKVKHDETL